jgi:hypothetical protein
VSDIDTAVVDSLKVLDLKWPIREADIFRLIAVGESGLHAPVVESCMSGQAHISERRAYPRRQIAVPAFIAHRPGDYFVCQVIDLAPNSARIDAKDLALPDRFVLLLQLGANARRDCRGSVARWARRGAAL